MPGHPPTNMACLVKYFKPLRNGLKRTKISWIKSSFLKFCCNTFFLKMSCLQGVKVIPFFKKVYRYMRRELIVMAPSNLLWANIQSKTKFISILVSKEKSFKERSYLCMCKMNSIAYHQQTFLDFIKIKKYIE